MEFCVRQHYNIWDIDKLRYAHTPLASWQKLRPYEYNPLNKNTQLKAPEYEQIRNIEDITRRPPYICGFVRLERRSGGDGNIIKLENKWLEISGSIISLFNYPPPEGKLFISFDATDADVHAKWKDEFLLLVTKKEIFKLICGKQLGQRVCVCVYEALIYSLVKNMIEDKHTHTHTHTYKTRRK
eukprot:GHVR01184275.1.p1 GENE.GHVR01184275.1~~GHVR01184275.1.p1  ORF type:complete len:211 (-),score=85.46 GHVR01184275.1:453-1004(-)